MNTIKSTIKSLWTSHKIVFLPLIETRLNGSLLYYYIVLLNLIRMMEFYNKDSIVLNAIRSDFYLLVKNYLMVQLQLNEETIKLPGLIQLSHDDTLKLFNLSVYALTILLTFLLFNFTNNIIRVNSIMTSLFNCPLSTEIKYKPQYPFNSANTI